MEKQELDMPLLGATLVKYREAQKLSTHRVAKRAGVSPVYLGDVEKGEGSRVGIAILARVLFVLGVSMDRLLSDIGLPTVAHPKVGVPVELAYAYDALGDIERRAFVEIGATLREVSELHARREREAHIQGQADVLTEGERPSLHVVANESAQDDNETPPPTQKPDEAMERARDFLARQNRDDDSGQRPAAYKPKDEPRR